MKIKVLFEDKNILALDKPAGIAVHGDEKSKEKTVADWILENYPKLKKVGESSNTPRPGIVHRLDRETSGVLLIAKNQKTFELLKEQFQEHNINKIYRAFVYGSVTDPKASLLTSGRGIINVPIGRSPRDIRMWTAGRGAREPMREAITEYVVLNRFEDRGEKYSYVEVYPKTGRTHQIRVHMRYINHPIVSDPLYRGAKEKVLGMKRAALHAVSISFHLSNGDLQTIESPLPADFKAVVKKYIS